MKKILKNHRSNDDVFFIINENQFNAEFGTLNELHLMIDPNGTRRCHSLHTDQSASIILKNKPQDRRN